MTKTKTTTPGVDAAEFAEAIERDNTEQQAAVAAAEQAAADAALAAAHAAQQARRSDDVAAREGARALTTAMRQISAEIDGHRRAALDAVTTGGDVLGLWITYRVEAARLIGTWQALVTYHQTHGGRTTPQGPTANVQPLPAPGVAGESFQDFLHDAVRAAESRAKADASTATRDTLHLRKERAAG